MCIFFGLDGRVRHGQIRQERRFRVGQCDFDGVVVDFLDCLQQFRHAHIAEVRVIRAGDLEESVVLFPLTLKRKQRVVRIEIARRLEAGGVVPFHALAQVKRVSFAVSRDIPFLSQAWNDLGTAALEVDQSVVNRFVAVERSSGGCRNEKGRLAPAFKRQHVPTEI